MNLENSIKFKECEIITTNVLMIDEQLNELVNLRMVALSMYELTKIFLIATNGKLNNKQIRSIWWDECKKNIKTKKYTLPSYRFLTIN